MRVLHFYRTYFPDTQGGLEESIRQICLSTKRHGIESRLLTLSPNPHPRVLALPEVVVYRAKLSADIASCSMGWECFSLFRELSNWADIIHYHFPWPFADVIRLLAGDIGKRQLVTYHSDIVRQRWLAVAYRPLMTSFLNGMDRIVATSPQYAQSSPVLKKFSRKVDVIPLGLDEANYARVNPHLVQRVFESFGQRFFLFVGVLREYKGLHLLLHAIQGLNIPLVIAGKGPMDAALKEQARRLGLTHVHFLGYVSDDMKMALLHASTAVILPSHQRSEAFGVSLLEAAMMGKPMICADINTGTSFVNCDEETGLLFSPDDPRSLRDAMSRLWSDQDLAKKFGIAARRRYENLFTAAAMGSAYTELYRKILLGGEAYAPG